MKISKTLQPRDPSHQSASSQADSFTSCSTSGLEQGLSIQEMAAHIAALRKPFPHMSFNPLNGNSLY